MMLGLLAAISAGCFGLTLLFAGGLDVLGLAKPWRSASVSM